MPNAGGVRVFYEGALDIGILESVRAAGLLPAGLIVQRRAKGDAEGDHRAVCEAAAFLAAGLHAIAMIDANGHRPEERFGWARRIIDDELSLAATSSSAVMDDVRPDVAIVRAPAHAGAVAIVLVGLREPTSLVGYAPSAFAMDDYVLRLALDEAIYTALARPDRGLVAHAKVLAVLAQTLALLEAQSIPVRDAKRASLLLRAFADYHASQAKFAEDLMGKCGDLAAAFLPLLDDLARARSLLLPTSTS